MTLKVLLTPRANLKARVIPKFPSRVLAANGNKITVSNGTYTFGVDYTTLTAIASISASERDNILFRVYDSDASAYKTVTADVLLTMISAGLDATLVSIAALTPAANEALYFSASDVAAVYTITAGGRAVAGLTGAADKVAYYTSASAAALTDFTAYGRSLVGVADEAALKALVNLEIGTDVQAYDAELAALAGLTSAADKLPYFTGSGTAAIVDFTAFGRSLVDDTDASAARTTLGVVIGTNVQAYDAFLASIAALGTAADKIIYTTGIDTAAEAAITTFGRSLIDDADASAGRTTLGVVIGTDVQAYHARLADIAGASWAQGDVLYYNGTNLVRLGAGTSGHFLKTQGAGSNPTWAAVPGGGDLLAANNLSDVASTTTAFTNITSGSIASESEAKEVTDNAKMMTALRAGQTVVAAGAVAFNGMQINGDVTVSQELGTTGATLVNNTAKYTADMWEGFYNHGAATAVVTSGQIAAASFGAALPGFGYGHRIKATTALSSIANGDFARHRHKIEGVRAARAAWGTSSAQSIAIAFQFYAMRTGTQMLRVSNNAGNRFYHTEFSVVAGWNFVAKTIPGDTSGTWLSDSSGAGLVVEIFGAGKAASPATADAWGATGAVSTSGSDGVNQYSANNDETVVTGLVAIPGIALPSSSRLPLLMRPAGEEADLCRRYYHRLVAASGAGTRVAVGLSASSTNAQVFYDTGVRMRAAPNFSTASVSNWTLVDGTGADTVTAMSLVYFTDSRLATLSCDVASGLTTGRAAQLRAANTSADLIFNARL